MPRVSTIKKYHLFPFFPPKTQIEFQARSFAIEEPGKNRNKKPLPPFARWVYALNEPETEGRAGMIQERA